MVATVDEIRRCSQTGADRPPRRRGVQRQQDVLRRTNYCPHEAGPLCSARPEANGKSTVGARRCRDGTTWNTSTALASVSFRAGQTYGGQAEVEHPHLSVRVVENEVLVMA